MAVDLGMALAAASVVAVPVGYGIAVIAMANPSQGEFRFARACFIVAAVAAVASFIWLSQEMALSLSKVIVTGLVGAVAAIGLVASLDWVNRKQFPEKPAENVPRILVDCRLQILPLTVPANETIEVLSLFPTPVQNGGTGLTTRFNTSGQPWKWPIDDSMQAAFLTVHRCEITNYGDAPIFDLQMSLDLSFFEADSVPEQEIARRQGKLRLRRGWIVQAQKIDPGPDKAFKFYIINNNIDLFVTVAMPQTAKVRLFGGTVDAQLTVTELGGKYPLFFGPDFETSAKSPPVPPPPAPMPPSKQGKK